MPTAQSIGRHSPTPVFDLQEVPMSTPTPEEIYYAAEKYLPNLTRELQAKLTPLLERALLGEKVDNTIIDLLSKDAAARYWMKLALFGEVDGVQYRGYEPLAGKPTSIMASSRWVCPQGNFEWVVLRAGRPVPPCPKDNSVLIPAKTKE